MQKECCGLKMLQITSGSAFVVLLFGCGAAKIVSMFYGKKQIKAFEEKILKTLEVDKETQEEVVLEELSEERSVFEEAQVFEEEMGKTDEIKEEMSKLIDFREEMSKAVEIEEEMVKPVEPDEEKEIPEDFDELEMYVKLSDLEWVIIKDPEPERYESKLTSKNIQEFASVADSEYDPDRQIVIETMQDAVHALRMGCMYWNEMAETPQRGGGDFDAVDEDVVKVLIPRINPNKTNYINASDIVLSNSD